MGKVFDMVGLKGNEGSISSIKGSIQGKKGVEKILY